jgi:hypothetical protein
VGGLVVYWPVSDVSGLAWKTQWPNLTRYPRIRGALLMPSPAEALPVGVGG